MLFCAFFKRVYEQLFFLFLDEEKSNAAVAESRELPSGLAVRTLKDGRSFMPKP